MHEGAVLDILAEQGIDTVATLPCDRTKEFCSIIANRFHDITLTREEDGIGVCAGLYLAGGRPVLNIQSSGLGNSLNAMMTLTSLYELPLPILASWRGVYKEQIPAQLPFNRSIPRVLEALNVPCTVINDASQIGLIGAVIEDAYAKCCPHVALVSPKVWEGERDTCRRGMQFFPSRQCESVVEYHRKIQKPVMTRAAAISVIAAGLADEAVVANIGIPGKELYAYRDRDENFYMLGSYTQASPIGLGVALKTGKEVVVLDGDGSLLGTSILPVIAAEQPENLTIVCLDNGVFGSTGNQLTPAYGSADMELLAVAAGFRNTAKVQTDAELKDAWRNRVCGPNFIHVLLKPGNSNAKNIPLSPVELKERFMASLQGG